MAIVFAGRSLYAARQNQMETVTYDVVGRRNGRQRHRQHYTSVTLVGEARRGASSDVQADNEII